MCNHELVPEYFIKSDKSELLVMMMNCFCGMVDWRKVFSLISTQDHCQRFSPLWISDMPQAGFEPMQNRSSGLVEWSCAVVITNGNTEFPHTKSGNPVRTLSNNQYQWRRCKLLGFDEHEWRRHSTKMALKKHYIWTWRPWSSIWRYMWDLSNARKSQKGSIKINN